MSIWESLGFRANPFDSKPLKVNKEDKGLFVGREGEGRQFLATVSSSSGGIIVVEGEVGVGKTSFVNIQQYIEKKNKSFPIFPSIESLPLQSETILVNFFLSTLSTIAYSLIEEYGEERIQRDKILKKVYQATTKVIHSTPALQIGGAGFTIGGSKSLIQTEPIGISIQPILYLLDELVERIRTKYGYASVFVPINNLDTLDESFILSFLNLTRDILLTRKNIWWVLIGGKGLFSYLESRAPRISEATIGTPVVLYPLKWKEIEEAIRRRIVYFSIKKTVKSPIPLEVVRTLYDISKGEIRFIFKRLTDLILDYKTRYPSLKYISTKEALGILRNLARIRLREYRFTKKEKAILQRMVEVDEFRPSDYEKFQLNSPQNFNKYLKRFTEINLLYKHKEGKASIYRPCADIKLVYQEPDTHLFKL